MIVKNMIMTIAEQNSEQTASRQMQQQQRKSNPLDRGSLAMEAVAKMS